VNFIGIGQNLYLADHRYYTLACETFVNNKYLIYNKIRI